MLVLIVALGAAVALRVAEQRDVIVAALGIAELRMLALLGRHLRRPKQTIADRAGRVGGNKNPLTLEYITFIWRTPRRSSGPRANKPLELDDLNLMTQTSVTHQPTESD